LASRLSHGRGRSGSVRVRAEAEPKATDAKPSVPDAAPASGRAGASSSGRSSTTPTSTATATASVDDEAFSWSAFMSGPLPGKLAALLGLIVVSRVGVYVRLPGVDVDAFAGAMEGNGLLGYVDALSGGSISKVGLFRCACLCVRLFVCEVVLTVACVCCLVVFML
jgi:hypothetical protein